MWFVQGHYDGPAARELRAFPSEYEAREVFHKLGDVGATLFTAQVELTLVDKLEGYL